MTPDSLDVDPSSLPRSFRGYNRWATEELFRRVAWDYGVLAGEHRKLKRTMQEGQPLEAPPLYPPPLEASAPAVGWPVASEPRVDPDEEARVLLALALRAVREMRESTREDCELALRKARGRAAEIEAEAERAGAGAVAVVQAASTLRATLRAALERLESAGPLSGAPLVGSSTADRGANTLAAASFDLPPGPSPSGS